jgi:hypothetical protein
MRSKTRVYGCAFVLGLCGLWAERADAMQTCPPGEIYERGQTYYWPARYTAGAGGDVAVNTIGGNATLTPDQPVATFGQQFVAAVVGQLGGVTGANAYVHSKILYDSSGDKFTETYPGPIPPSSNQTGEPNVCSEPLSPFYLGRMAPGAVTGYDDAEPGILVKGFGKAACTVPADGYHITSIFQDTVPGGSCEKELVDYCGVPVEYNNYPTTGDRLFYSATEGFAAFNQAFTMIYGVCMGTISSSWPPWGIGCGGTSTETACARAAWEFVNEVRWPAYPMGHYGLEANCNPTCNPSDGWSDYNVLGPPPVWGVSSNPPPNYNVWSGTMLGAGKINGEYIPVPSLTNTTGISQPPVSGMCDNGSCDNWPITWLGSTGYPAWTPSNFTLNIPQNIINAATRLGKTQVKVGLNNGIADGYYTHTMSGCVPEP